MKTSRVSSGASLYEHLRRQILDNILEPGQRLLEADVAADSGLSRTPVREAFTLLRSDGLVTVSPSGGVEVTRFDDPVAVSNLYDMRIALEGYAYACAGHRRTDQDLQEIEVLASDLRGIAHLRSGLVLEVHRRLEKRIVAACGNPSLIEHCELFGDHKFMRELMNGTADEPLKQALENQLDIVSAIAAQDGKTAERLRREALEASRVRAMELVAERS